MDRPKMYIVSMFKGALDNKFALSYSTSTKHDDIVEWRIYVLPRLDELTELPYIIIFITI